MNSWWAKQNYFCRCQGDDPIIHTHYDLPGHKCARCIECRGYSPLLTEKQAIEILIGPEITEKQAIEILIGKS